MGWKPNLLGLIKQDCIFNFSTIVLNNLCLKKETPLRKQMLSTTDFKFVLVINKLKMIFPLKNECILDLLLLSNSGGPHLLRTFKSYLLLDTLWLWIIAIMNSCWSVNGRVTFDVEFLSIKRLCGNFCYNWVQNICLYMNESMDCPQNIIINSRSISFLSHFNSLFYY